MSRLVSRGEVPWDDLVPLNVDRWSGSRFGADGGTVVTLRNGPVTIIVVKSGELTTVTKMMGGRELARRVTQRPPQRLYRAIRKARPLKL